VDWTAFGRTGRVLVSKDVVQHPTHEVYESSGELYTSAAK
jgi:hypothetical protein